jgi:isopentenyl diphosphate isomerase/L-lactate dehydrogenase-like FMN-dependent dehydrogenase
LRRNREALAAQCLRPRVMIDVCKIDTRITLFLRTEFEAAMGLCGRTSIGAIDRSVLW